MGRRVALALLVCPGALAAQREAVLKQIDVPHSYYWREMQNRMTANDTVTIPVAGSGWWVLRAYADRATMPVLDLHPFASTSPISVEVGDTPVRSAEDAAFFSRWIDRIEALTRATPTWNSPAEQAAALRALADARAVLRERRGARE